MFQKRYLTLSALAVLVALSGCATSRSELRLSVPGTPSSTVAGAKSGKALPVYIRSVKDERSFEQAPREASTPSLGFEGAAQATAAAKSRAIGRKRNGFGKALGDVFLQDDQSVESVVRDNLTSALTGSGYDVLANPPTEPGVLVIDVQIKKFWAWVQPGFWAITVHTEIGTDLLLSSTSTPTSVVVHVEDGRQFVTDSAWLETVEKALLSYRREVVQKLPASK